MFSKLVTRKSNINNFNIFTGWKNFYLMLKVLEESNKYKNAYYLAISKSFTHDPSQNANLRSFTYDDDLRSLSFC